MELLVFKPVEWSTTIVEFWDGGRLVAELFARNGGAPRLYVHKEAAAWGLDWNEFSKLVPEATAILERDDAQLGEGSRLPIDGADPTTS